MRKWIELILCLYPLLGYSQMYESAILQQIGIQLHLDAVCKSTLRDTTLVITHKKYPVRIDVDTSHVITHVGYKVFQDSISIYPTEIERFIERYMLQLALPNPNGIPHVQQMKDDGVTFNAGSYSDVLKIDWSDSLQVVSLTDLEKGYAFTIAKNKDTIAQFVFPKDVQLIRGLDKTEVDQSLFSKAKWNTSRYQYVIDTNAIQHIRLAPFDVIPGSYYLSDQLTNNVYVQKKNGEYTLLYSPYLCPKQTLQNIMLYGCDTPINLCVEHHRYGYNRVVDTIPLNVWINLAYEDGCTPYWGVEKYNAETISGSYIWVNEPLGYLHVLFVEFPIRTLWGKDNIVRCSLHSYVRMSNVTDLFYDTKHSIY